MNADERRCLTFSAWNRMKTSQLQISLISYRGQWKTHPVDVATVHKKILNVFPSITKITFVPFLQSSCDNFVWNSNWQIRRRNQRIRHIFETSATGSPWKLNRFASENNGRIAKAADAQSWWRSKNIAILWPIKDVEQWQKFEEEVDWRFLTFFNTKNISHKPTTTSESKEYSFWRNQPQTITSRNYNSMWSAKENLLLENL